MRGADAVLRIEDSEGQGRALAESRAQDSRHQLKLAQVLLVHLYTPLHPALVVVIQHIRLSYRRANFLGHFLPFAIFQLHQQEVAAFDIHASPDVHKSCSGRRP